MVKIRGTIGQWPVDLSVEMDAADWAQLAAALGSQVPVAEAPAPAASAAARPVRQDDAPWQAARELLRTGGPMSGPALLEQLEGLAGSTAAGKRLLVRLRHSSEVQVQSGADAPVYSWKQSLL